MTDEKKMQDLEAKLSEYLSNDDVEFIKSLIKEGKLDSNLKIMENSCYNQMSNRGIWDTFEKASHEVGIEWRHSNEPES